MTLAPANSHGSGYPLGLPGAVSPTRYVGGTATVAPTTGTFAVGDFVITADAKVFVCTVAGTPGTWVQVGGGALTTVSNYLTGDVAVSANNTFFDGPSVSLVAGTWFLYGVVSWARTGGAGDGTAKLWDGTNVASTGQARGPSNGVGTSIPVSGVVVVASTTTWKISLATGAQPGVIQATNDQNGTTNKASYLLGVKIG